MMSAGIHVENNEQALLSVDNITVWRGDNLLLNDVCFTLNAGQVLQVRGANGSGKTTLLRVPGIKAALTPVENLRIFCALSGLEASTATDNAIASALAHLSLESQAHLACRHLSAGQQRRVSLARLLLHSATLWVLDEPLTSLDKAGLMWVEHQISQHVAKGGAVLLTTHAPLTVDGVRVDSLELG